MTAKEIKEFGLRLGYSKVGITSADDFTEYLAEVDSRGDLFALFNFKGARPRSLMPEAKSIIVLIWDYYQHDYPQALQDLIGKVYLSRSYNPLPGTLPHARLALMKDYLIQNGCAARTDIVVPARWAAAQAGATSFGRNNFAYADGLGSYLIINTIVVDAELPCDEPTWECNCPPNCQACLKACPTQAIESPFHLNPQKCIGFNNWVTQDGRGSVSSFIPLKLREPIGGKIHGCDICQDVCPRNQQKRKAPKLVDPYLEAVVAEITLPAILNMSDDFFQNRMRPLLYNYIHEKRYLQRNAALAMGNSGNKDYVPDLKAALQNPDEMVREYAAWALEKLAAPV